jgi:hypothetical protein
MFFRRHSICNTLSMYLFIKKIIKMKKLLFLLLFTFSIGIAVKAQDDKDKIKNTSTPVQKVHNTVSHHKKYKGYKVKHHHHHKTSKHKVEYKDGDEKTKKEK